MAVNKVVANGETLIDLSNDTVTAASLLAGITAHDAAGNAITGIMGGDEKYLEKPYGLTDFWDLSDNVSISDKTWKSKLSSAFFSGEGDIILTNDLVQFDEEFICNLGEQHSFTVYAIARASGYISDRFILCSTSDGAAPQLSLCSNNGQLDITGSDSNASLWTNIPAYGEWHVCALVFEGACGFGKGSLFIDGVIKNQYYNYYAPYAAPADGNFRICGQYKMLAVCSGCAHGQDVVAENSAYLRQKYLL